MVTDVTAERGAREQVQQAEKMSVIGEMLSGVAHELNNPLASVVGFSQLLLARSGDDGQRQRLALIAEEAQRARRIVANLLDVARTRPPETTAVSLDEVVKSILALFSYAFRVDEIQVEWRPAPDLPAVMGDRSRLQQILVNLISNAHHALRDAGKPRRLILSADGVEDRVRLEVADNGMGIPETHLEKIFAPFFTTKAAGVGTGLGLSICARIAEEHGGSIQATSRPGEGATFILDLPAAVQVAATREAAAVATPAGRMPRRILVVEDEAAFRGLLQEALQEDGSEIVAVGDGEAALEALAAGGFDAVVSDVRMPRLNGVELHHRVKQRWPQMAGRFVFITGDVMDAEVRAYLQDCGSPFLPKPFGLEELTAALATVAAADVSVPDPVVDSPPE
jgi:two-component system NtrC family sensor kinase